MPGVDQDLNDRPTRAAANQALFREVNERVEELNRAMPVDDPLREFICECAAESCFERIELTFGEYERLRSNATDFAIAPSAAHLLPDIEAVVERNERFWVVRKAGDAGEVAEATDPRDPETPG